MVVYALTVSFFFFSLFCCCLGTFTTHAYTHTTLYKFQWLTNKTTKKKMETHSQQFFLYFYFYFWQHFFLQIKSNQQTQTTQTTQTTKYFYCYNIRKESIQQKNQYANSYLQQSADKIFCSLWHHFHHTPPPLINIKTTATTNTTTNTPSCHRNQQQPSYNDNLKI